jgi:hypothetical protein
MSHETGHLEDFGKFFFFLGGSIFRGSAVLAAYERSNKICLDWNLSIGNIQSKMQVHTFSLERHGRGHCH